MDVHPVKSKPHLIALPFLCATLFTDPVNASPQSIPLPDLLSPPAAAASYPIPLHPLIPDPLAHPNAWDLKRREIETLWKQWLGGFPEQKVDLEPQFLEREELPTFTRQRVTYQIEPNLRIDAILLLPKQASGKLPTIILFHPTYENHYRRVVGLEPKEDSERLQAVQWVEAGYVVIAPRCFLWEDIPPDYAQPKIENSWAARARHMRETHPEWRAMTRTTWDGIRAIDFAETLPQVDPHRIALFGHSLGAKEVLYVGAFDKRPRCMIFSEGGIGMHHSNWNASWYLGPECREKEQPREHHELLALIAPRPFLLLAGGETAGAADTSSSWTFIEAALPVYRALGFPGQLGWYNHGLGHRYGENARSVAEAFFQLHLKNAPEKTPNPVP